MKMYFEFNEQDYYGLITVETDPDGYFVDDAAQVYVDTVGGETIEEILEEGEPVQVSKEYAFWKLANCHGMENQTLESLLKEFEESENTAVVIDGSLV